MLVDLCNRLTEKFKKRKSETSFFYRQILTENKVYDDPEVKVMLKGYLIREDFEILAKYPSILEWLENQAEYQVQLERILIAPEVILQKVKSRLGQREDMIAGEGCLIYLNQLTSRKSVLESEAWHLMLSDEEEYPFMHELKMLEGSLIIREA